ncbi:MAG: glycosyltransferase family 2 protein [Bdellovibrionales bacterium]
MRLSVIVCTHNLVQTIQPCLDSITASLAHASPVQAEIIIVTNSMDEAIFKLVHSWAANCGFPTRILRESRRGLAAARNCALREAKGELLAFIDNDCRLDKEYVAHALRQDASDNSLVLRGGRIELGDSSDHPIAIKSDRSLRRWSRKIRSARYENLGSCILGGNMMMRRAVIDKLGLFDERFGPGAPIPLGLDTDYVFRAYLADIKIEYMPDLAVFRYHGQKSDQDNTSFCRNQMVAAGALYAKFFFRDPDILRPLYWSIKGSFYKIFGDKKSEPHGADLFYEMMPFYQAVGAVRFFFLKPNDYRS